MNVLWVEDFGGGLKADSTTLVNMFRGLLSERLFDDEWNPEADLLGQPAHLRDFFLIHSPTHSATLLRHYGDFQALPDNFSEAFDAVALDINLSRGVPGALALPAGFSDGQAFHVKAGFYIYNHLLRQGFPAENICFLTGEKESTFGEFSEHCQKALIPLPMAFGKDDAGLESFRAWLAGRQKSAYVQLRRGVIEGCHQLRRQIAEHPETIQFRLYLDTGQISAKAMDDYLATLEKFLPARKPTGDELSRLLRLFVRALAHEWESEAKSNNIQKQPGERLPYVLRAYGWVMKMARNWLAHGEVLDQPSPAFAAYLFTVNLRAMFALPAEAQRHEYQLFDLFGAPVSALPEIELRATLEQSFAKMVQQYLAAGNELLSQNFFHDLANKLENGGIVGPVYTQLLLQALWHQLMQRPPRNSRAPTAYGCDCRAHNLKLSDSRTDFLNLLLRHIWRTSFGDSKLPVDMPRAWHAANTI